MLATTINLIKKSVPTEIQQQQTSLTATKIHSSHNSCASVLRRLNWDKLTRKTGVDWVRGRSATAGCSVTSCHITTRSIVVITSPFIQFRICTNKSYFSRTKNICDNYCHKCIWPSWCHCHSLFRFSKIQTGFYQYNTQIQYRFLQTQCTDSAAKWYRCCKLAVHLPSTAKRFLFKQSYPDIIFIHW